MSIRVRFAPSPTGVLHIGSVRTALFNWLFARHNKGKFLLRIEDTDKLRSIKENTNLIFEILHWLNIDWDEEPVIQSSHLKRHIEVANELIRQGKAYYCYCTPEELAAKKEAVLKAGKSYRYDGTCRNRKNSVEGISPVIRLKAENNGKTTINDMVQGNVTVDNEQLDDLILVRSDGSPTYMLSVVVDDHDMGITHVIRGDDHLTNTFRQIQIYNACNWDMPSFGHIPLIYGPDGTKLSKRHGAVSAKDYQELGYLPEAITNYLLRLGWSHGNEEIISREKAIEWFDFDAVGKSPSRFDMAKLQNLNMHYIKEHDNQSLLEYLLLFFDCEITASQKENILKGLDSLKSRAKSIIDLKNSAQVYISAPVDFDDSCSKYASNNHLNLLFKVIEIIENMPQLEEKELCLKVKELAAENNTKLVEIAQAIRGALCGKLISPSVFEIIEILGKSESIDRINNFISYFKNQNH